MNLLLARYQDRVLQFVSWKTGVRSAEAEDIAQDVFLQVFRSAGSFAGRARFRTWLYSVAANVCSNWLRGTVRRRRILVGPGGGELREDAVRSLADERPTALERIEQEERHRAVRQAVDGLDPEFREVLLLVDWEEMSYAEVADVLAVPVGTVKSRVHHARLSLGRALGRRMRG